ncbi:MAG: beta-N-acetylhexosaminidase [Methylococcales symbiont of Hymedesmia sp. n. MRB-2018]|nr:MAG: beta-N-acetylhexosaminidase [Methylococcales symbiont of Hymedesmia sp. n. MRB-2018]KAF3983662.1 MAG: beta-N-acetylhexosaminidase [Methylococcales symbiont of Hymedesmia sp. n. MRB-2018]
MIDLEGLTLTTLEQEKINHPNTGAVILFSRNYNAPEQITQLIQQIRSTRNGDILIAVDQEGGRVQRFQTGFSKLPAAATYAQQPELTEIAGWLMAAELLAVGIDFSFAPVLDIDCGISKIIGDRSFSTNQQLAAQLASQFRAGMCSAGMAATGKHFPGHGAVAVDSHLALPVDNRDLQTIFEKDLLPFKQLINEGLEAIMPAHVVYPQIDSLPAGFSTRWIKEILRDQLNFDGTIFSDDLSMEGAVSMGNFNQRAELALQAGCDMVLVCNNPTVAEQVLTHIPITQNSKREQRLKAMKGKFQLSRAQLLQCSQWQQASDQIKQFVHA